MIGCEHNMSNMSYTETQALSRKYLASNAVKGEEKEQRAVGATHTTLPSYTPSYAASEASEFIPFMSENSGRDSAALSQDLPEVEVQEVIEEMDRKELRDLAFPFLLADPSKPLCPLVACSNGFTDLTGHDAGETLGQKAAYHLRGKQAAQFLECSSRSELYTGAVSCLVEEDELVEGELFTMQNHSRRSGEYFSCVTFLKQVYIEDEMFVVALQASPEGGDDDSLKACVVQLKKNMEAALQVLPSLFWFSAPIMRLSNGRAPQVKPLAAAEAMGRTDSDQLREDLEVAVHALAAQLRNSRDPAPERSC